MVQWLRIIKVLSNGGLIIKNIVIVGGGISGMTAAAYLLKKDYKVTILENSKSLGGLIGSFDRKGFVFDSGIRAIENSGTMFPMLRELGIEVPFIKNNVFVGIEDKMIELSSERGLDEYTKLLISTFPKEEKAIKNIIKLITKISKYMEVLYGIDNPLFLDPKENTEYFMKTILPWMFKYMLTINKIQKLSGPVNNYLFSFTNNRALIDMVTQHFFEDTPTFFALSYFRLYTDYYYPKGGTGTLIEKMQEYLVEKNALIKTKTKVTKVDLVKKIAICEDNSEFEYDKLLWAADLNSLYEAVNPNQTSVINVEEYKTNKKNMENSKGNDSIYTLYLSTDLSPEYYKGKCSEHTFYTPNKVGLTSIGVGVKSLLLQADEKSGSAREELLLNWVKEYAEKTTYEISIPVLRDKSLAPEGKSGLIISTVFDFALTKYLKQNGMYKKFKEILNSTIIDIINESIFNDLKENIIEQFSSSPLTYKKRLNNTDGAITGWSFTNKAPVEDRMKKIAKSVKTPFESVYQSGHWVFSPSGLPTAIITAKLASNEIIKAK